MATLAPAPPEQQKKKITRGNEEDWRDVLMRSRYFVVAVALHGIAFLMVGTIVIFEAVLLDDEAADVLVSGDLLAGDPDGSPDVTAPEEMTDPSQTLPVSTEILPATSAPSSSLDLISTTNALDSAPSLPVPIAPNTNFDINSPTNTPQAATPSTTSFAQRAKFIREFQKAWGRGGRGRTPGSGRNTSADFRAYIAKYRDGDWAASIQIKNNKIVNGSIVNLMATITEWTNGKVKATLIPKPLDLGSQEIFDVKPPFIYMTGHKDFTLTDAEVENLRKYLVMGGCVWGDNGLAGEGSRFDVAFKREMKRVLADADKRWKTLPNTHPIYTRAYYKLSGPPPGMVYYDEPLEAIEMDDQISVLYTPNNYSDMFRMVYKRGTRVPKLRKLSTENRITPWSLWNNRELFYRNFEAKPCEECYKLGINIIIHLLTRFDEQIRLAPQ